LGKRRNLLDFDLLGFFQGRRDQRFSQDENDPQEDNEKIEGIPFFPGRRNEFPQFAPSHGLPHEKPFGEWRAEYISRRWPFSIRKRIISGK
jgi:hypothetical protein